MKYFRIFYVISIIRFNVVYFKFNLDKMNVIEIWIIYHIGIMMYRVLILKFNFWNSVPTYNILLPL